MASVSTTAAHNKPATTSEANSACSRSPLASGLTRSEAVTRDTTTLSSTVRPAAASGAVVQGSKDCVIMRQPEHHALQQSQHQQSTADVQHPNAANFECREKSENRVEQINPDRPADRRRGQNRTNSLALRSRPRRPALPEPSSGHRQCDAICPRPGPREIRANGASSTPLVPESKTWADSTASLPSKASTRTMRGTSPDRTTRGRQRQRASRAAGDRRLSRQSVLRPPQPH